MSTQIPYPWNGFPQPACSHHGLQRTKSDGICRNERSPLAGLRYELKSYDDHTKRFASINLSSSSIQNFVRFRGLLCFHDPDTLGIGTIKDLGFWGRNY
ncbi:uncharacterized protein BT62DRAFT_936117 [Guyanagaster necrorhizus]|uniref:Uncharacterized protein n=1 Tax=Guyanagaster necrorhizus TaxID=856835 RepID=A0A9P7VKZ5_9AGAR|nr:uncharacterized protein BT62DRAFT_936117 [Guyanagaster necrorhizus MCA 3950]KAG7442275.1 hypothetical protein BT62DRAFT_936117 [Guyanagaster necrorhizus MCA 3950]